MADLDKETIEAADQAFDAEIAKLDDWESAMAEAKSDGTPQEVKEPEGKETGPEPETVKETGTAPAKKLTRDEAKALVLHDYDSFDDVVSNGELDFAKLAEYTSVIVFWFKSFKSGKEKQGQIYKYPKFLELFGASKAHEISISAVLEKFAPDEFKKSMEDDRDADRRAMASAEVLGRGEFNTARKLDDAAYEILKKYKVNDPEQYKTVGDVLGTASIDFGYDESSELKCVYNSSYADAMEEMTGEDMPGNFEEISMEDVMAGVDMDMFNRMTGRGPKAKNGRA